MAFNGETFVFVVRFSKRI